MASLSSLRRQTAQESALEALRAAILGNELRGGTRLVVASLAEQLGVSITPVREAMRELATQGLIRFEPYKGAVVCTPTLDEVREVYEARLLIEPVVVRKAVERITAPDLEAAQRVQQAMTSTADVATWVVLNRRFHGIFTASACSPRLASIIEALEDAAAPQVALSIRADYRRVTDGNIEHQQLLGAFQERDADRAVALLVHHLESTVRAVESLARQGPERTEEEDGRAGGV
ncbi:MAG: GntR family transcriptional regulator [Acidimicrobiales bacterium]